jgi:hypothetical protein
MCYVLHDLKWLALNGEDWLIFFTDRIFILGVLKCVCSSYVFDAIGKYSEYKRVSLILPDKAI